MHAEFEVETTGLHVNPKYPYLGASPDGLVTCACCGNGLLEVKCPYSVHQSPPTCAAYLHASENGGYSLSRDHEYYFQIQGQMGITERPYCDFVCWTLVDIHRERIEYDPVFFSGMDVKLRSFFLSVIFPVFFLALKKGMHILVKLQKFIVTVAKERWETWCCVIHQAASMAGFTSHV